MKPSHLCLLALASSLTSSCFYFLPPTPEMPYTPHRLHPMLTPPEDTQDAYDAAAQAEGTWMVTPPPPQHNAAIPDPAAGAAHAYPTPQPPAATHPAPRPNTAAITQPQAPTHSAPIPAPTSGAKPAPSNRATAKNLKDITNDGPIPVATPVPGKPGYVYNPIQPDITIRVTDKNGKPYPSGKMLKVRGTNFFFYVP